MTISDRRRETIPVMVGGVQVGGGAPVVVQSMTNTATADVEATVEQVCALAEAGSELVRFTVNSSEAAEAVPEIRRRVHDRGCRVPLVGDFHYNGHALLKAYPECAEALDKYRINPGNVGKGERRDERFSEICRIAADRGKPVRIGVNSGSVDRDLLAERMQENREQGSGRPPHHVIRDCMVESALGSAELAVQAGLPEDRIILSCKSSDPLDLIEAYRELSEKSRLPLHLGLTEAGIGMKGLVWSSTSLGVLLSEGIGDTIRVSITPRPGEDRRAEVYAACEILQSLGLRSFAPSVTACPGCGRTSGMTFQELAERVQAHVRAKMPEWRGRCAGVEGLHIAVMGCIVNGPGESESADIGISLPGSGEEPECPVFMDGEEKTRLRGDYEALAEAFCGLLDEYVENRFGRGQEVR